MYFNGDIEKLTLENTDYRRVIFTSKYSQLVLMSIPPGQDIELEIHPNVDQFFRFEQGTGEFILGEKQDIRFSVKDRSGVVIPFNTYHRLVNTGNEDLKLYSIYSPPNHPVDRVDKVRPNDENKLRLLIQLLI